MTKKIEKFSTLCYTFFMKKSFEKFNIILSDEKIEKFEKYYQLLIEYNQKFNITAITERQEVIEKHFIDSLLNVDNIDGKKLIDIGSGGGFPAIPIRIFKDDLELVMVDSTGKKCEFLRAVVDNLRLTNVSVICGRAEDLAKDEKYREKFDICSARAVARLNTLCEYCMPFVKVNGKFVAYKGNAEEEIVEAKNAIKVLGGKLEKVDNFLLNDANRQIITIRKEKSTPAMYPRGNGKERKKPL